MTIKDLFFKPLDRSINGVVKADQSDDATVWQELEEYVVTNELEKHFRDFFESYSGLVVSVYYAVGGHAGRHFEEVLEGS